MQTRFYVPQSKTLKPIRWLPTLTDARRIASGMATRGEECEILMVRVEGPDTEVIIGLQRHLLDVVENGGGPIPDGVPYWTVTLYETHQPTDQLPLPGDGPELWDTKVVSHHLVEEQAATATPPKKKSTTKKGGSK